MAKYAAKSKSQSPSRLERRALRQQKRTDRHNGNVIALDTPLARNVSRGESLNLRPVEFKTASQQTYYQMILEHDIVFGTGPAGTGKTHIPVDLAALMLMEKKISKIIVSRPIPDEGLGYLPGTIEEKWQPYFRPLRQILLKRFGPSHLENLIKNEQIEIAPIEYIRGNTFEDAFVILDEAQNCTPEQMKTFLTRLGRNSTVVITGDDEQVDIKGTSGLPDALERLSGVRGIAHFEFGIDDIVRHGLVREIILRYRR